MASHNTRRGIGKEKDLLTKKSILPGSSMKLVYMARSVHERERERSHVIQNNTVH